MIFRPFSARVFSLVFAVVYGATVATDHPLFRYYPLVKKWSMQAIDDRSAGPAMMWYGWIVIAAIPAVVLALLTPSRWGDRIPGGVFWVLPLVLFLICWYHERVWF